MRLVKRIRRQNSPEAYADIIRSFTVHPHLVLCRSLARSSSSTKVGGRQSRELTPDQPKAACFALVIQGCFGLRAPHLPRPARRYRYASKSSTHPRGPRVRIQSPPAESQYKLDYRLKTRSTRLWPQIASRQQRCPAG